jgi:hypothetical protein
VDHATLGAVVSSSVDGQVVVSDILDSSDAWRRGLRHDDEIVAIAGRPVRTVNAFKNVLGTLPAGWQVPLVYRRAGRRVEARVRLAGVHAAAELAAIVAGEERRPDDKPGPAPGKPDREGDQPAKPRASPLPAAAAGIYESRPGFANHHFNVVERDRVAKAIAARRPADSDTEWTFSGTLATGEAFRVELSDDRAAIDLPTGTSAIDPRGELDKNPEPPGSGGLLAALVLWRRLVREGPSAIGRTSYWGTAPLDPATLAEFTEPHLVDVLESAVAGVEARLFVDASGRVVGIDLWTEPDADPCEVRLAWPPEANAAGLPAVIDVRRGTVPFGTFKVDGSGRGKAAGGGP